MANWKKMAEAFGRAVNSPTATARGQALVTNSKTVKSAPGDVGHWSGARPSDMGPEQRAYLKGYDEAERINGAAIDDLGEGLDDTKLVGSYRDKLEDAYTDRRLRKDDFDAAFEEAVARRKGKSGINRGYPEARGLSPEEIDQIDTDENRRILIDLLKKNSDTGDVLRNFGED